MNNAIVLSFITYHLAFTQFAFRSPFKYFFWSLLISVIQNLSFSRLLYEIKNLCMLLILSFRRWHEIRCKLLIGLDFEIFIFLKRYWFKDNLFYCARFVILFDSIYKIIVLIYILDCPWHQRLYLCTFDILLLAFLSTGWVLVLLKTPFHSSLALRLLVPSLKLHNPEVFRVLYPWSSSSPPFIHLPIQQFLSTSAM